LDEQSHQCTTSLPALREVIGEVSFNATSSFSNGKGISAIATSFEKEGRAPNLMVLQGVLTSSNIVELGPSFKLRALKLEMADMKKFRIGRTEMNR
jgi:hypothetical protein